MTPPFGITIEAFTDFGFWTSVGILAGTYTIFSLGLQLNVGYTGIVNFGQAGFMAIGAYAMGILVVKANWSFWLALPAAVDTDVNETQEATCTVHYVVEPYTWAAQGGTTSQYWVNGNDPSRCAVTLPVDPVEFADSLAALLRSRLAATACMTAVAVNCLVIDPMR